MIQPRGQAEPGELDLSLRLKHGIHTIFLIVNPLEPFAKVTDELLQVLRERYPGGLTTSVAPPETLDVPPADEEVQVSYGILKAPTDPSQGWKKLVIEPADTPASKGLKNNTVVAFTLLAPEEEPTADFEVEFAQLEDED